MVFKFKKNNGISEQDFQQLRNSGIIQPTEPIKGPTDLITLQIPRTECEKIPGAQVGQIGEVEVCYIPIRREGEESKIVPLKIIE